MELRSSPEATALARAIRRQFPAAFAASAGAKIASVELPVSAARPIRLTDEASAIGVAIALDDVRDLEGGRDGDLAVYPGAAPSRGDLFVRVLPEGVEDLVYYAARPAREHLRYRLDLGAARGLRLVEGVLEILDAQGAPVLRVEPPYVIDAQGRHAAELHVAGCDVDRSPRAPFGRPLTSPGADTCAIDVDWSASRVGYPALVDPIWVATLNTMLAARARHTITLLNPTSKTSLALVAGGFSAEGGAPLKSAEIYDPLSRRFSVTGSMTVARGAHTATLLAPIALPPGPGPDRPVLVAGGADAAGAPIGSLEVYDPVSGVFVTDGHVMAAPRFDHAAAPIADAEVLLAGGTAPPLNQPTKTAYTYLFSGFGPGSPPASVISQLDATVGLMAFPRSALTATRLNTGKVLLTGGFVLGGGKLVALPSAELFDPSTQTFLPIAPGQGAVAAMTTARGYHTATLLGDTGKVLITGGLSATVGGIEADSADLYDDGSKDSNDEGFAVASPAISMATGRTNHTATLLPDGRVLVAGGFKQASALGSAELFSPATKTFTDLGAIVPMAARGDHAAILVNAGDFSGAGHTVLVTGGASSSANGAAAMNGAQVLLRIDGDPCTVAAECASGYCVDGVCCDTLCDADCYACSADLQEAPNNGTCGPSKQGSEPRIQCVTKVISDSQQMDVEVHSQCNGQGSVEDTNDTKICTPAICGKDNLCSTGCSSDASCAVTGWCDLGVPSPEGDPGTCVDKMADGLVCGADDQCRTGNCIDGFCCDKPCGDQCKACDVAGHIGECHDVPKGDVHPGLPPHVRQSCAGSMGDRCAGYCDTDVSSVACQYPDANTDHADADCQDSAVGPAILVKHPCDAAGGFTDVPRDCGGFHCEDAHTCKTACESKGSGGEKDRLADDENCIDDHVCVDDVCVPLTEPLCDGKGTLRRPKAQGGNMQCPGNLRCPEGAHECLQTCKAKDDCISPGTEVVIACTSEGKCENEDDIPVPVNPYCHVARPGNPGSPWWGLGLTMTAIAAAARRVRRDRAQGRR
ncbi:MAG: kelch repeat-containing protein [Byssovorax sp.]